MKPADENVCTFGVMVKRFEPIFLSWGMEYYYFQAISCLWFGTPGVEGGQRGGGGGG